MNANKNPDGESPEQLAIRRVRAVLGKVDVALGEIEEHLQKPQSVDTKTGIIRGAALALGELGSVSHEVRRELLALFNIFYY